MFLYIVIGIATFVSIVKSYEEQRKAEEIKKKEEMKKQELMKKSYERQKELRMSLCASQKSKKKIIKETLEDMCIIGTVMKEKIIEEKKQYPDKFVDIKEATKEENKNSGLFCLGLLAQNLENVGITTAIEKNNSNSQIETDAANTTLQFVMSGLAEKKKYSLHFDFGEDKNEELLDNIEEQVKFNDKLRKKLSKDYNIPEDKIIITCPQRGSYNIQVIFETDEFNNNFNEKDFKNKFNNDKEFKELCHLKEVHQELIMSACKLSPNMLDSRGNRESGWGINEKRGGEKYLPPIGWKGYGLNVFGKYDDGNNDWLAYDGNPGEWCVAYHGIGAGGNCKTVPEATNAIYRGGFKAGSGQAYADDADEKHPGQKVGIGVYCSPDPNVMDIYAKDCIVNGKQYKMGFMMRVKPDKIRRSSSMRNYWVLDGTPNEMRPYRILVKEV